MAAVGGPTRVRLVGDGANPRVRQALDELIPWLEERAQVLGVCDSRGAPLPTHDTDLVIILGGDGAILAAASRMDRDAVPLIGIRLGHFGFLAELEPTTCREHLTRILAGEGRVVKRMMLRAELRQAGVVTASELAVNDTVVTALRPARLVSLDLEVNGERVATYRGDGLILSTPLGSTAHSLAAGGPVVEPDAGSILVTPLASHSLTSRPLVLNADRVLSVRLTERGREEPAAMAIDGQRNFEVGPQDEVIVRQSRRQLRIMTIVERSFFETLRRKFRWGGSVSLEPEGGA